MYPSPKKNAPPSCRPHYLRALISKWLSRGPACPPSSVRSRFRAARSRRWWRGCWGGFHKINVLENAVVIKRAASRWSRGDSLASARLTCSRGEGWAVTQGGGYLHKNNAQNESEESINWKLKNREVGKIAAERLLFPLERSSGNKVTEPDGRSSSYRLWCFWTGQSSLFFLSFFFCVGRNSIFFWAGQQLNWMGRLFAEKKNPTKNRDFKSEAG